MNEFDFYFAVFRSPDYSLSVLVYLRRVIRHANLAISRIRKENMVNLFAVQKNFSQPSKIIWTMNMSAIVPKSHFALSETAPFGIRTAATNGIACLMRFWTRAGALSNSLILSTTSRGSALPIDLTDVMTAS